MVSGPNDGEWDHNGAGGGERTTGASGVSVVAEGDRENNSLGDVVSLGNGNTDLWGLDVAATFADTNLRCAICPAFTEPLEEAGTIAGPPMVFMATDGVAEVGGEERDFA